MDSEFLCAADPNFLRPPLGSLRGRNEQLVSSLTVNVREAIQMDLSNLPKRYRAIIADDDPMFRYAHQAILNETCEVSAEAENGLAAIQAAEALHPDLDSGHLDACSRWLSSRSPI